jgi:hypothetical protein
MPNDFNLHQTPLSEPQISTAVGETASRHSTLPFPQKVQHHRHVICPTCYLSRHICYACHGHRLEPVQCRLGRRVEKYVAGSGLYLFELLSEYMRIPFLWDMTLKERGIGLIDHSKGGHHVSSKCQHPITR